VRAKYRGPESQVLQQHGSNIRRESWLLIGLAWLLKLEMMVDMNTTTQGFLGRNQEGIRLQIFRFFGGWVWGEG
jgi:hypothetical protein